MEPERGPRRCVCVQVEAPTQIQDASANVAQAILVLTTRSAVSDAATVVGDCNFKFAILHAQAEPDFSGAGMPDDVVQRLFHGKKQVMARLGWQRLLRKIGGNVEPATNRCRPEKFLGE